jgi:hypothetical protein
VKPRWQTALSCYTIAGLPHLKRCFNRHERPAKRPVDVFQKALASFRAAFLRQRAETPQLGSLAPGDPGNCEKPPKGLVIFAAQIVVEILI